MKIEYYIEPHEPRVLGEAALSDEAQELSDRGIAYDLEQTHGRADAEYYLGGG